jgi:hypothetical protein
MSASSLPFDAPTALPALDWRGGRVHPATHLVRAAWLIFALALAIKTLISPEKHTTFPLFHQGSLNWAAGVDPYAASQFEYRYSPVFTVAFTPFSMLPVAWGGVVWSLANIALLWYALVRFQREVIANHWNERTRAIFLALALAVSVRSFWAAQCNTLITALACLAACEIAGKKFSRAALWLAIPVYIKVWPIAFALLLLACWPKRLILPFVGWCLLIGGLPFLAQTPEFVWQQYSQFFEGLTGPMQVRHIYRDAWTIWEFVAPPVPERTYKLVQLGTAGLTLLFSLWHAFRQTDVRAALLTILCGWSVWQLVFGPGSERNTFCVIAPLIAWGLLSALESRRGAWLMSTGALLVLLFSFGLLERKLERVLPGTQLALPIGVLLCGAWLVIYARPGQFSRLLEPSRLTSAE